MRIVLTGATGFVGQPLVERLADRGDEVVVLSRNAARAREALPNAAAAHDWNPMAEPAPAAALEGADAVIHLAGESVVGRWTDEKKASIRDSRVVGTQNLVAGMLAVGQPPWQLVSASAIGYYGQRGDEALTEASAPGDDFLARTCLDWEAAAQPLQTAGVQVAHLRVGLVLAPGGGALGAMMLPFKLGVGGPLGSGRQWWSWIAREDLVSLFVAAVDGSWEGAFNATAPRPVRQKEFASTLGRVLHRPAFLPAPAFALKLLLGEFSVELLSSKQVLPRRAGEMGFEFAHRELEPALREMLD